MPALDFPNSPSDGDTFEQYIYDGTKAVWRLNPEAPSVNLPDLGDVTLTSPADGQALIYDNATGDWVNQNIDIPAGTTISDTAPVTPEAGELWWNSNDGKLYIYYNDGTSSQWVSAADPKVFVSDTAPTGYDGQLWLDSTDGSMYVYYTDPDGGSSSWIGAVSRSGGILQVVSTTKTDTFTTTSTSFVDITGLSATITPRSTSSKIMVVVTLKGRHTSSSIAAATKLVRNSTDIAIGTGTGSRTPGSSGSYVVDNLASVNHDLAFLDSPATTSSTVYKMQARVNAGGIQFGATGDDSDSSGNVRYIATITLIEVAG